MSRVTITSDAQRVRAKSNRRKNNSRRSPRDLTNSVLLTGNAISRVLSPIASSKIVTCHKWRAPTLIQQATAAAFGSFDFRLADTDADNLTDHYEHYRIMKVEIFFRPQYRCNNIATLARMPILYVAADQSDSSNWTSLTDAQGHDNLVTMDDSQGFCFTLRPLVNSYVYSGSAVNSGIGVPGMWLVTSDSTVRHYGVKWAISGAGGALTDLQEWNVDMRYTVQMRFGKSRTGTFLTSDVVVVADETKDP